MNERTVRIRVWLLFYSKMSEATEETITSIIWQVELPGVLVLHVLQLNSPGRPLCMRSCLTDCQWGKIKTQNGNKSEHKHCSQNENRLNLQESQLKLNCESGITLYIKKEKKENNLALSPLVVFSLCLIYDLVWKSDLLQVFYFFSSCKLPGKKENRQKKP